MQLGFEIKITTHFFFTTSYTSFTTSNWNISTFHAKKLQITIFVLKVKDDLIF